MYSAFKRRDIQIRALPDAALKINTAKVHPQDSYVLSVTVLCLKSDCEGSWPKGQEQWKTS
jgi:hypothetical protein